MPKTIEWLIWSNEHMAWWRADSCGYTTEVASAGRYTERQAVNICTGARAGTPESGIFPEVMIPAHAVTGA
jgi:hypothetical protein